MADEPMMALTVRPPWSWAIAHAGKLVENRGWQTRHRGVLAIHSGSKADPEAFGFRPLLDAWRKPGMPEARLDCGYVVAVAEVAECHRDGPCEGENGPGMCSPWAMRYGWHWVLAGVRPLARPVECQGSRRLWPLPGHVEKAVRAQLEVAGGVS